MMITIHGLPPKSKYQDVKVLIKQECKISDFILDNLVAEPNGCKKVRVGLTDDDEGYRLMKCLDRYRCSGNFVLSVLPVGKPTLQNATMQNTYDSRGGFQSQPRNDYPPSGNYGNHGPPGPHGSTDMPSRPQQWVGNNQNNQWNTTMSSQVPQNSFGYQQNTTAVPQNQPFHQQHSSHPVRPEIRSGPQGRGPQEQSFGFPKSNLPDMRAGRQEGRTHVLRSVELLDAPSNPSVQVQGRYPPNNQPYQPQDKPMTIMKDNFQGPSSYMANNQQQGPFQNQGHGQGQGHSQIQPWVQPQGQQMKQPFAKPNQIQYEKSYPEERKYPSDGRPDMKSNEPSRIPQDYQKYDKSGVAFPPQRMELLRRHSPSARPILPSDGRVSPSGRGISAPGRRVSPPGRVVSASGRGISPTGRSISASGRGGSPPGRRVSPSGRHIPPTGRHVSPPGRRSSPSGRGISPPGRRISPPGRRVSPPGRRVSSPGRRISPSDRRMAGRVSPGRRLVSPPRRDPQRPTMPIRYSPSRLQDKPADKYGNDSQKLKQVRPAYEPTVQAPNQIMYSGGYRPNIHENVQYPIPGARQGDQSPWQQERDKAMYSSTMKKMEEERRDVSRAQVRGVADQAGSPRASRSPLRRDRSPIRDRDRDRFKRHSPSPRSPRRSWALEKRRSPEAHEAPPPPVWPGQSRDDDFPRHARPEFPPRIEKDEKKHVIPPWERPNFDKDDDHPRRPAAEEMRPYSDERSRRNIPDRDLAHASYSDRFPAQNPKVAEYTREDFERERRGDFHRQDDADRKPYIDKRDYRDPPRVADREDRQRPEPIPPRRQSPICDLGRKGDFRKEIDRDFEDVYKKALEFKKKAEQMRKSGERKREGYSGEERGRRDDDSKYYEHRREAESLRYHDNRDDRHDYRNETDRHTRRPDVSPDRSRPTEGHHERDDAPKRKRFMLPPLVKVKRDKAVEDLSKKIMDKHLDSSLSAEQKLRIREELRLALSRILFEMFGEMDVSYIEIVIKYQAKYNDKEEHKILRDVMASMPSQYRNSLKRPATDSSAIPSKSSRWSPAADLKNDGARPVVYTANPKLRKDYEDFKKDVTSLKPKPQRLKQRVIQESDPEDKVRSTRVNNKLRPRMKYEAQPRLRVRSIESMKPLKDQKVEPDTRPEQMMRSQTKADHKIKTEAKLEYKMKPEVKPELKMKPEPKIKPEAKPEHKIKSEITPEIKEKSGNFRAEQKVKLENKMKPDIIKSDQRVKEIRPEQKTKPEIISEQNVKPELSKPVQKLEVEKKVDAPLESFDDGATPMEDIIEEELPAAKPCEGHFELNPLMTRMVEAELQDIMIKVWQELPDNSQDDGEKLVADKLRNVAGDDIRNVFGLNVTKRLLNVYNPLFVKIQFSGKPDRINLAKFLRKYNFIAFKRIGKADVFAAQMKTIKDFDRICIAKDIMCGDVKVTVNPCYRFTKCPANLKTAFDDRSEDDENGETAETKDKPKDIVNADSKLELNPAKSQNTATDSNVSKPTKSETEPSVKAALKTIESEEKVTKTPTESETNVAKPSPSKSEANTVKTGSIATPVKNAAANTTKTISKAPITESVATKPEQNITKAKLTIDTQSKTKEVESEETNNKAKGTGSNKEQCKKAETNDGNKSDNDELDDNDMFALISGGIVLDECSGSDDE